MGFTWRFLPAVAVARFTSVFGALLLAEGTIVALTPHRVPGALQVAGPDLAPLVGTVEAAIGATLVAARLLHLGQFSVNLLLFWGGALLWVPAIRASTQAPLVSILLAGLILGALVAPWAMRRRPNLDRTGRFRYRVDLAETVAALVVAGQGLALVTLADHVPLLDLRPDLAPLLPFASLGGGTLLLLARPLGWPAPLRWLGGLTCAAVLAVHSWILLSVGINGGALAALTLASATGVGAFREPANAAGPTTLRNRAAVVVVLATGFATFLVALLASGAMAELAAPSQAARLAMVREQLLGAVLSAYAIAGITAMAISHFLGRELAVFGRALTRIAAGNYDQPLPARRGDERDVVLEAFDLMRTRVRSQLAELERSTARLLSLHRATLQLTGGLEERALVERGLGHALNLLGADMGGIWLREPARADLRLVALRGEVAELRRLVGDVAHILSAPRVGRMKGDGSPYLLAPLQLRRLEMVGAIAVVRQGPNAPEFTESDVLLIDLFAGMLANSVHTVRLVLQLGQFEGQQESERMKAEFLASVSHELRTPLTMVHGYAELLRERTFTGAQVQRIAGDIFNASSSLARMVDDLLDYSRLEAGRFRLNPGVVDINEVIGEAVSLFRHQLGERAIMMELAEIPSIVADGDRVRQAVANLVSNALKYGPDHGLVRVRSSANAWFVQVSVRDDGPGVPVAERERVFERFYRSQIHNASTVRGVGLGLAVVRAVAEGHGGSVGVESAPSGGSIFWITLPVDGPADEEAVSSHHAELPGPPPDQAPVRAPAAQPSGV